MDKGAIRRMIAEAACWCSLALFLSGPFRRHGPSSIGPVEHLRYGAVP
jgi:hypothetical protein